MVQRANILITARQCNGMLRSLVVKLAETKAKQVQCHSV